VPVTISFSSVAAPLEQPSKSFATNFPQPVLPPLQPGNFPDDQGGPAGSRYAPDSRVWGLCDKCGFRFKLSELRYQIYNQRLTGYRHCPECYDDDDPQLQLGRMNFDDVGPPKDPRPSPPAQNPAIDTEPVRWSQAIGFYLGVFVLSTSTWEEQPRTLTHLIQDSVPGVLRPQASPVR
jgi:hypothetical protein